MHFISPETAWLEGQGEWLDERGYTMWDAVTGMLCPWDAREQPPRCNPDDWDKLLALVIN